MNAMGRTAVACFVLAVATLGGSAFAAKPKSFATPEEAGEALVAAAERYDVKALEKLLGSDGADLVETADPVQDKNHSVGFAAEARKRMKVVLDPEDPSRATLVVGDDEWPMPIPIVKDGSRWAFDSASGREEILRRRIGANELDAIEICRGYVEAQHEYASEKRDGALVNQYAQRIVSTPGKRDGLAWKTADGTWEGPVGEGIARVIAEGYSDRLEPYHGYYYKVLKGQGPSAPLGEMDYVVNGAMIGGFALVAAPADYEITGVKTFLVGYDGIVYEKDLGPDTVEIFRKMERYDPDETWTPVPEE